MRVAALDHVNIITADLEGTVRFYAELLELEPLDGPPPLTHENARWLYDESGRAILHINTLECPRAYDREVRAGTTVVDLALFYERNNLLLNGDVGWVPGNVYGTIVDGLDRMAEACNDVWRSGSLGERLVYQRFEQ